MIGVDVRSNAREVIAEIDAWQRTEHPLAMARALNRTIDGARTQAVREIRSRYKVRADVVRKAFATQKATRETLRAVLQASGRPLPLIGFGARQVRAGVSVAIKDGRKVVKHAFVQTIARTGYVGVFQRKPGVARLPIKQLYSISVPGVFMIDDVQAAMNATSTERFEAELTHQLDFLLSKGRGR